MADFLLEIGLEEVPARMIASAEAELLRRTLALLGKEALLPEGFDPLTGAKSFSTPRRLAVLVRGVREQQADLSEEVVGPATKIAFKDGQPGPAAEAFARKSGIAVSELKTITTPKGEYIAATLVKKGRSAAEVLAGELPKEIAAIYWAKNMRWIPRETLKFVRPVLWIVCLLGEAVVALEFAGRTAGRASFGHRVLSTGEAFEVVSPESYLAQLEGEFVIADVEARRHKIRKALDRVTREVAGARWREDEALVDAVTHLTEWPDVLLGNFEADYLALPEEVLVTVMRDHQKYFAVEDAHGKLAPHFLTVTNIALDETNSGIIRQGNERVLKARFNDARFFWEFDQRTPLVDRVKLLENVTFQKELGSYSDKATALKRVVRYLAILCQNYNQPLSQGVQNQIEQAALLAKTDLTTELVKEFTELQGQIGGLYASAQNAGEIISECLYWQYEPKNATSNIPPSLPSQLLSIADRINTVVDMFAIGNVPTGSKDPFSLRRQTNGIVKILAEGSLPLSLDDVIRAGIIESKFAKPETVKQLLQSFIAERVDFYLREIRGQAYDVVKAVMASGYDDLRDAVARAEAVSAVRGSEDFLAVSAAFKRMKNIVAQAKAAGEAIDPSNDHGSVVKAQLDLKMASGDVGHAVKELAATKKYVAALEEIATLRPKVDAFFEQVMVMDPDPVVRNGRLVLLTEILSNFSGIADFSEIVVSA